MKKLLLILLCVPLIGLGQCVSGDCENGYGTYNLAPDENTLLIQINKEMSSLAILQKNSSEWKYLEWKEDLFEQIDIIPDSIIEELKQ